MDALPAWFAIPVAVILWATWIVLMFRDAPVDPDPELSRLDHMDGLGSRLDVTG